MRQHLFIRHEVGVAPRHFDVIDGGRAVKEFHPLRGYRVALSGEEVLPRIRRPFFVFSKTPGTVAGVLLG